MKHYQTRIFILISLILTIGCQRLKYIDTAESVYENFNDDILFKTNAKDSSITYKSILIPTKSSIDIFVNKVGLEKNAKIRFFYSGPEYLYFKQIFIMNSYGEVIDFEFGHDQKTISNPKHHPVEEMIVLDLNIEKMKLLYDILHDEDVKLQFKGDRNVIYDLSSNQKQGLKEIIKFYFD